MRGERPWRWASSTCARSTELPADNPPAKRGWMVPEVGLEPTLAEANTALNRARLPIPPLRQRMKRPCYRSPRRASKRPRPALARGRPALAAGQATQPSRDSQHSIRMRDLAPVAGGTRLACWRWSVTRSLENTPCGLEPSSLPPASSPPSALPPRRAGEEEDGYRHGRVRFVEPGVTLQRATEVSAEEALANQPVPARRPRLDRTPTGGPSSSSPTGRSCASTPAASSTTRGTRRAATSASCCGCGRAA